MTKHTVYVGAMGNVTGFEADGISWSPVEGHCRDCKHKRKYRRKLLCARRPDAMKTLPMNWCREFESEAIDES